MTEVARDIARQTTQRAGCDILLQFYSGVAQQLGIHVAGQNQPRARFLQLITITIIIIIIIIITTTTIIIIIIISRVIIVGEKLEDI